MGIVSGGSYAEFLKINNDHIIEVPTEMSIEEAAAIPEAWLTAFKLLRRIGNVQKNDWILVHGAASGVGTALIQLIKLYGAKSIGICSSESKKIILEKSAFNKAWMRLCFVEKRGRTSREDRKYNRRWC